MDFENKYVLGLAQGEKNRPGLSPSCRRTAGETEQGEKRSKGRVEESQAGAETGQMLPALQRSRKHKTFNNMFLTLLPVAAFIHGIRHLFNHIEIDSVYSVFLT